MTRTPKTKPHLSVCCLNRTALVVGNLVSLLGVHHRRRLRQKRTESLEIMDRPLSPASSPSVTTSPPSSPAPSDPDIELQQQQQRLKKKPRKKRKQAAAGFDEEDPSQQQQQGEPSRKKKPKTKRGSKVRQITNTVLYGMTNSVRSCISMLIIC